MVGSVLVDAKRDLVANLFDGRIFQKTAQGWTKFNGTFFRSLEAPQEAVENDIWLSNSDNQLYLYNGSEWQITNRILYFTEEQMDSAEGNLNDYNVLSGIIQVGPIVKFGTAEIISPKEDIYGFPYVNPVDKKVYVRTDRGDYRLIYEGEEPNKSLSMATALSFNNDLYPVLDYRKTINS